MRVLVSFTEAIWPLIQKRNGSTEVQLWVNNPASEKMSPPDIDNLSSENIPNRSEGNLKLRVISGILNGMKGSIQTKADTQIAHLIAKGSGSIEIGEFPQGNTVMGLCIGGQCYNSQHCHS